MKLKNLVVINTVYGLLQYVLYDKNWKKRDFVIFTSRMPKNIVNIIVGKVKNAYLFEESNIRFRSGLSYIVRDLLSILKFKKICKNYCFIIWKTWTWSFMKMRVN